MNLPLAFVCIVPWTMTPALMVSADGFMDPATTTTTTMTTTSTTTTSYDCPKFDIDFYGCDLMDIQEVKNWHACGELCESQTKPLCHLWTLTAHKDCTLKTCEGVPQHKKNYISGARGCK